MTPRSSKRARAQGSGAPQEHPPHGDAVFGVVEPLQGSQVVGQRVRAVPGQDGDHQGGGLHPRLLGGPFLGKVAPGGGKQGPEEQKAEEHGGSPDASAVQEKTERKRKEEEEGDEEEEGHS